MSFGLRAFRCWLAARGSKLLAVLAGFGVQARVRYAQALDWLSADDVRFDNFIHIGLGDVAVPDRLGIDYEVGAMLALVEAAGLVGSHSAFEAALRQLLLEQLLQAGLGGGIAASTRMACGALVSTDENVLFEFRHQLVSYLSSNRQPRRALRFTKEIFGPLRPS
jgi:hypothetical protein